jgi:hypothetical protein
MDSSCPTVRFSDELRFPLTGAHVTVSWVKSLSSASRGRGRNTVAAFLTIPRVRSSS